MTTLKQRVSDERLAKMASGETPRAAKLCCNDLVLDLRDARAELAALRAERDDLRDDAERREKVIAALRKEAACPECGCATPEDAEANECGCDAPVCARTGTLAEAYVALRAENEALRAALTQIDRATDSNDDDLTIVRNVNAVLIECGFMGAAARGATGEAR